MASVLGAIAPMQIAESQNIIGLWLSLESWGPRWGTLVPQINCAKPKPSHKFLFPGYGTVVCASLVKPQNVHYMAGGY